MPPELIALSPRQTFEDNMRPAKLLLQVYRLLDSNDDIRSEGEMMTALRQVIRASAHEELMLVYNEIFLGLVRERAQLPRSTLRQASLCHLLRQAVVASCTALETYLPALLRADLPIIIRARGRDFLPYSDKTVKSYFTDLHFSLDETLRLLNDPNAPEYIANKIFGFVNFKYLSQDKGVHTVGALLGLIKPWEEIAAHLNREQEELTRTLNNTIKRRNDIVHRADRSQDDAGGDAQSITYAWTQHAVDTINHVCLALDELVAAQVTQMQAMLGEE